MPPAHVTRPPNGLNQTTDNILALVAAAGLPAYRHTKVPPISL